MSPHEGLIWSVRWTCAAHSRTEDLSALAPRRTRRCHPHAGCRVPRHTPHSGEKIRLPRIVLDEPESLIGFQGSNGSRQSRLQCCHESVADLCQPQKVIHRSLDLRPRVASYFDGGFLTARFRTSVGEMSTRLGRGCSCAMCVDRRLVATCFPQNLQRALPGEMWTRCIPNRMSGSCSHVKRKQELSSLDRATR